MNLSESLVIFSNHLPDIRKACVENVRAIQLQYFPYKELDIDGECSKDDVHQHANYVRVQELSKSYLHTIKRIDGRRKHFSKDNITEAMIDSARERSIVDLFTELTGQQVRNKMVKCPFHDDSTASMSLGKYNRYTCFGCDEKGDTIDLYMKLNGVNFIQAVKYLQ